MSWFTTGGVAEFLDKAGEFLHAEPARNTVILSVTESLRLKAGARRPGPPRADEPLFGWWRPGTGGTAPGTRSPCTG
jgi:hypothetical protein